MTLDDAFARLYSAPLADFVPTRKAIATELKKAGDSEAAAKITEARKPTATAWAANQISHRHPKALLTFTGAIEALRDAQRDLLEAPAARVADAKAKFREARNALNGRVVELVKLTREALEESGAGFNLTTQKRITATLHVLPLASAEDRRKFMEGRLERDLDASSDEDSIANAFGPVDESALGARQREREHATKREHDTKPEPKAAAAKAAHAAKVPVLRVVTETKHAREEARKLAEKERMERVRREAEAREKIRALEHKADEADREAKRLDTEAAKAEAAAARARGDADRAKSRAKEARERLATLRDA